MATTVIELLNHTLVQVAAAWPTSHAGWETIKAFAKTASHGLANDVGKATFYHPAGSVIWPGTIDILNQVPLEIDCQYVRILLEDPAGEVADGTSGKYFTPIWYGKVVGRSWKPNSEQTGLDVDYDCAGLMVVFDQMIPFQQYQLSAGGENADITLPLPFNGQGGKKRGNRSASTSVVAGAHVFIFDPNGPPESWTAAEVLDYLLALAKDTNPGGPTWTVAGLTSALEYTEKWDLSGMTLLECITRLANPRNGLGYRLEMSGLNPTIHIVSLSASAVTAGGYTLPASTEQVALDLTDDTEIIDFGIRESQLATYDRVGIVGGADIYAMTLDYVDDDSGAFTRDWNDADELALNDLDVGETAEGTTANAFRRYKLRILWAGTNYTGSFSLPTHRSTLTDGLHGTSGYSDVDHSSGALIYPSTFKLTKDLPVPVGYNWESQDPTVADLTGKSLEPQVYVKTAGGTWETLAEAANERQSVQIDIDEDCGAVTLGPPDIAFDIQDILNAGGKLYFTLGVKSQLPLMATWNRTDSPPVELSRSILRHKSSLTRKTITQDTIFGVNSLPIARAANVEVSSDMADLNACLALAVAWYGVPDWEVEWTKRGVIDASYGKPGTLYTEVEYRTGNSGTDTVNTTAVVTNRSWDFTDESANTHVSTKRIQIDIATVF